MVTMQDALSTGRASDDSWGSVATVTAALQGFLILAPETGLEPVLCSPTPALCHALLSVTQRPLP